MFRIYLLVFLLSTLSSVDVGAHAAELPTSLTCRSNAKATRDYGYTERRWVGQEGSWMLGASGLFKVATRDSKVADVAYSLRDKVFSGLNTDAPLVRTITRFTDGGNMGEEFVGAVVSRTGEAVFLLWTNDINKTWTAAVDLARRKAVVAQVFQGVTSVGGMIETLDCH